MKVLPFLCFGLLIAVSAWPTGWPLEVEATTTDHALSGAHSDDYCPAHCWPMCHPECVHPWHHQKPHHNEVKPFVATVPKNGHEVVKRAVPSYFDLFDLFKLILIELFKYSIGHDSTKSKRDTEAVKSGGIGPWRTITDEEGSVKHAPISGHIIIKKHDKHEGHEEDLRK